MNATLYFCRIPVVMLIISLVAMCNNAAIAQKTTIWLVRHAEKNINNPADKDPELSAEGMKRAEVLVKLLENQSIGTIYSTNYKRTLNTVNPLAKQLRLTPVLYSVNDVGNIAQKAVEENKGKGALIVGHSNTIIPVIKALNCPVPFDELNDVDYDLLFKVIIDSKGKAMLSINHYGEKHHITEIPAAYIGSK